MNNNLIIFYKDKSKDVFSFSPETDEQSALEFFEGMRPEVNKKDIEKYFYITEDESPLDLYGNYAELTEERKMKINLRNVLISKRIEEIRKKRDAILVNLDVPFMKSLEEDDLVVKNHIVSMKNFLRDLPENLNLHELSEEEIIKHNPFGNIFEAIIAYSPTDYTKPPSVTIDPPKKGVQAKAMAFIKDGKISKIEITDHGNGYNFLPKIEVGVSDSGEAPKVMCGLPQNCFLTDDKIFENTKDYYS